MRLTIGFSLALAVVAAGLWQLPNGRRAVVLAQAPDSNQDVLAELKAIRAALGRLVELAEAGDSAQRASVALQQAQLYDGRLRSLRAQHAQLAAQERDLSRTAAALGRAVEALDSGLSPNGLPMDEAPPDALHRSAAQGDAAAAAVALQEVRDRQQAIEREMAVLQGSLARLEKLADAIVSRK